MCVCAGRGAERGGTESGEGGVCGGEAVRGRAEGRELLTGVEKKMYVFFFFYYYFLNLN